MNPITGQLAGNPLLAAGIALAAGVAASASPCVIGGIPLMIAYVCGIEGQRSRPVAVAAFVAGMVLAITVLGVVAAAIGLVIGVTSRWWGLIVAAAFLIGGAVLLGWQMPGVDSCGAPRTNLSRKATLWTGFGLGAMFGSISSPCGTPVLFAILGLVSQSGSLAFGGLLLLLYALGHSTLVAVAGLSAGALTKWLSSGPGARWVLWLRRLAGAVLVYLGLATLRRFF